MRTNLRITVVLLSLPFLLAAAEQPARFLPFNHLFTHKLNQRPNKSFSQFIFTRVDEPKEHAFSLLVPKGWQIAGGILRINPLQQGGPAQSIAAKVDFAVKKDQQGSVMIRWLPDVLFMDMHMSPAGQMGMFPPGSNYNGMTVYPVMPARQFLAQIAFPYAHPAARNMQIIEQKDLLDVARKFQKRVRAMMPQLTFTYDAATLTVTYLENGRRYREKITGVVENWGQLGAGMWGNKETFFLRTPDDEFDKWQPVFAEIQNSVKINLKWLAGELWGQAKRGEIMIRSQQEAQRIGRQIVANRQKTNAEINNDMFLTFTEQEEYLNPYTKEIEMGSNQWAHRWINESGEVIYTDSEDYNPNTDVHLQRSDYKRTRVRKR